VELAVIDLTGESTTESGEQGVVVTLTGYRRCVGKCPSAGTISVADELEQRLVIGYLGDGTLPDGESRLYTMAWCASE